VHEYLVREYPSKKVPNITPYFWVVKILTTAMGEATSDYLVHRIDPAIAAVFGAIVFAAALAWQLMVRKYIPGVYWLAAAMVAVFGTMVADAIHVKLLVPYSTSVFDFTVILIVIFVVWFRVEKSLSIHSITTARRELFYWATVLATFALGTAVGDLTAFTFKLGFFSSGLVFAGVIAVPAILYRLKILGEVAAFWFAYIVTRPLGASFADWMGVPHNLSGLNFGRLVVAGGLTILIVAIVAFLTVTHADEPQANGPRF
jgi:uncharacterized membrane-anchored protein